MNNMFDQGNSWTIIPQMDKLSLGPFIPKIIDKGKCLIDSPCENTSKTFLFQVSHLWLRSSPMPNF